MPPNVPVNQSVLSRRQHNEQQLVFKMLSDDIIKKIITSSPFVDADEDGMRLCGPCLMLSHTCSRFRSIALATPEVWTEMPLGQPSFVKACINRSKPLPIDVVIDASNCEYQPYETSVNLALRELRRIGTLALTTYVPYENTQFIAKLASPVPLLKLLYIEFSYMLSDEGFILPKIFAGTVPPKLEFLQIANCGFPKICPLLFATTLTSLHLTKCTIWDNVEAMYTCLARLQNLELILLEKCTILRKHALSSKRQPRSLVLPKCTKYTIGGEFWGAATLLYYLSIPPTVHTLQLLCDRTKGPMLPGAQMLVIPALSAFSEAALAADRKCTNVTLNAGTIELTVLGSWGSDEVPKPSSMDEIMQSLEDDDEGVDTPSFAIMIPTGKFVGVTDIQDSYSTFDSITKSLPFLTSADQLSLMGSARPEEPIYKVMAYFPASHLQLDRDSAPAFIAALQHTPDILPALAALSFHDVRFTTKAPPSLFDKLMNALESRFIEGSVDFVSITQSTITRSMVDKLRNRLSGKGNVLWDGVQNGARERESAFRNMARGSW
ncbi:hypothetical protein PENSPDRAFT_683084 [Peniophora sp. CONT]|nr:hypothetical protein PENSPDRAFT_683084 [Peniophora sp. CONT]